MISTHSEPHGSRRDEHLFHQARTSMPPMRSALMTMALCVLSGCGARADTADNVRLARRVFLEDMAGGRLEHPEQIYGADFVSHGAWFDFTLAQDQAATRSWRAAMPDLKVTVARTVAENDL